MASKAQLTSQLKSTGTAYLAFFFLTAHYAYMGKWGMQLLFWGTLCGGGIWWFVDMFRMSSIVRKHNNLIYLEIEEIDKKERRDDLERLAVITKS